MHPLQIRSDKVFRFCTAERFGKICMTRYFRWSISPHSFSVSISLFEQSSGMYRHGLSPALVASAIFIDSFMLDFLIFTHCIFPPFSFKRTPCLLSLTFVCKTVPHNLYRTDSLIQLVITFQFCQEFELEMNQKCHTNGNGLFSRKVINMQKISFSCEENYFSGNRISMIISLSVSNYFMV